MKARIAHILQIDRAARLSKVEHHSPSGEMLPMQFEDRDAGLPKTYELVETKALLLSFSAPASGLPKVL
jgi:hypothetical protein